MSSASGFRPVPAPAQPLRHDMLKKGMLDPQDLIDALSRDTQQEVSHISDRVAKALEDVIPKAFGGGSVSPEDAGVFISTLVDRVSESLLDSGVPGGPLLSPDIIRDAVDRAVDSLSRQGRISRDVADTLKSIARDIAERVREKSAPIAKGVIDNLNISSLSDDQFRKLMEMVAEMDLKPHGVGSATGAGILGGLWAKLLVDPRTRAYIRSRIRDLRTASYYREMRWPKGKRLEPRETFRKYFRTGIPFPPVYKTTVVRPRTREDVVFFVDVSGSMSPAYPVIYSVMKAMEDLGLNVRMYAGDTRVEFVTDVDKVLAEVGGGGTAIGSGANQVLDELGSTLRGTSFVVYTDLEFTPDDFEEFLSALDKIRGVGSKVSVWVYDCNAVRKEVDKLEGSGFHVVCDVRSMEDMLSALNRMRKELIQ